MIKLLFLSANPDNLPQLRPDVEMREIIGRLHKSRARFDIWPCMAARYSDLTNELMSYEPNIVHFSAHGSSQGSIYLEDEDGKRQRVLSANALSKLFHILRDDIRCVVLNGCNTAKQAKAIAREIDCVVAMQRPIRDEAAIQFAAGEICLEVVDLVENKRQRILEVV